MPRPLQLHAPTALEYFALLVADDASLSLIEAAATLAHDEFPQLDTEAVLAEVDALAHKLKKRIPSDAVPLMRLRWLNRYFFQELGFSGNVNNYYDPHNSYLHCVLRTRRGIPITLALLYNELATQIGLSATGVAFPGHFLAKLGMPPKGEIIIDPFTGQSLSRPELEELLLPFQPGANSAPSEVPLAFYLRSAEPREVLARMLRNLKEIHRGAGAWQRLLAVTQRLVILLPQVWEERRDRGLAYAELGADAAAALDLATYLEHAPRAADRRAIAQRLVTLRSGGAPRLH